MAVKLINASVSDMSEAHTWELRIVLQFLSWERKLKKLFYLTSKTYSKDLKVYTN